jgi:chromosomal replication initiator protein
MHPLSNKLKSRLEGGLVVDLQPPDLETRLNILRAKAANLMTSELEEVLHIVAERVCENVRQLEGALVYLTAQAKLSGAEITPKLISDYKTDRRNEGAAPKTVNNELALMSRCLSFGDQRVGVVR